DYTWLAETNAAAAEGRAVNYNHPQFGTGSSPVLPYYIRVGAEGGVAGPFSPDRLAEEAAKYNVDANKGPVYQLVRAATGEGTDWYGAITRVAPLNRHSLGINGGSETS